jgi:two-component system chemotaxis response regulator CheB
MARDPIPTVVISALTARGARVTISALEAGAVDVVAKPAGVRPGLSYPEEGFAEIGQRLQAAAGARLLSRPGQRGFVAAQPRPKSVRVAEPAALRTDWAIAIGASTGGVQALTTLLPMLPANSPPVVIVQHMPEGFTTAFARRLDTLCAMNVREAADGDLLVPGTVLIAPGGDRHLHVEPDGDVLRTWLVEGPPICFSRPSVDVMFTSLAAAWPGRISAAVLTGMGSDGADGLCRIRAVGGRTFAQDEATSQINGMPARAWERGGAEERVPIDQMAARLLGSVGRTRPGRPCAPCSDPAKRPQSSLFQS